MITRKPQRSDAVENRTALLKAGAEIFARDGFHNSNIRDICRLAEVNTGAISHHFGTKEALYREVLVTIHKEMLSREPMPDRGSSATPSLALKEMIRYLLRFMLLRRAAHPQAGRLISLEISQPTSALDELIGKVMLPVRQSMELIVGEILGQSNTAELRGRCTSFVMGLCVVHELGREVIKRFGQPIPKTDAELDALAELVTDFALGGIEKLKSRSHRVQVRNY